jgi:hypothetical protein
VSTASDLIFIAREHYLDDTEQEYLWSDAYLLYALNEAQREACRRQRLLMDEETSAICELTLVSGTSLYSLDSRVLLVDQMRDASGNLIAQKTEEELSRDIPTWRTDTGEPLYFVQKNRRIRLSPIPTDDEDGETRYLSVWRLPLADIGPDDSPEIDEEYHEFLLHWVAYKAFHRRDEDTYDPEKAGQHRVLFEDRFGSPVRAGVREHQRRSPKVMTLRGNAYISNIATNEDSDW